jgi:hypothetical protein
MAVLSWWIFADVVAASVPSLFLCVLMIMSNSLVMVSTDAVLSTSGLSALFHNEVFLNHVRLLCNAVCGNSYRNEGDDAVLLLLVYVRIVGVRIVTRLSSATIFQQSHHYD